MLRVFQAFFSIQRGFKHFQWGSMVLLKLPVGQVLWVVNYMSSCIVDLWLFEIVVYSYRRDSSPLKKGDRRMSSCDVHLFPPSSWEWWFTLVDGILLWRKAIDVWVVVIDAHPHTFRAVANSMGEYGFSIINAHWARKSTSPLHGASPRAARRSRASACVTRSIQIGHWRSQCVPNRNSPRSVTRKSQHDQSLGLRSSDWNYGVTSF